MKLLTILTILLLILPITIAQDDFLAEEDTSPISNVNIDKSVSWITQQSKTTSEQASLALLAATKSDAVNNQDAITQLLNFKNKQAYCFPSECNTKDTALALMSLSKAGQAASTDALLQQQKPNIGGEWLLQIDTQSSGTCTIKYGDDQTQVQVENSRIKSDLCEYSVQFNLNDCLKSNLLKNKISMDIIIQCGPLGSGKISLLYKIEDKYFLVGEVSNNVFATLKIKNSNFGDYESTLYASWALESMGKRFYTPGIESSSLMYLITKENNFINDLLNMQDTSTGSFGSVFETSLANLALRKHAQNTIEIGMAKSWLESVMLTDNTWNKDVRDTSMAIYGAFAPLDIDITPSITPSYTPSAQPACNENGVCDTFLDEDSINCPSDCFCGDDICDSAEDEISCPQDCEEEEFEPECYDNSDCDSGYICEDNICIEEGHGFFYYLFILIIILAILGGVGYFYYKKFYLTGKQLFKFKKPSFPKKPALFKQPQIRKPAYQPRPQYKPVYKARKTLAEKQLEESLKEAKKLLGKK